MNLELDDAHSELLREIVDRSLRDLRSEIVATDKVAFKRGLVDREEKLRAILDQLGGPFPSRP